MAAVASLFTALAAIGCAWAGVNANATFWMVCCIGSLVWLLREGGWLRDE